MKNFPPITLSGELIKESHETFPQTLHLLHEKFHNQNSENTQNFPSKTIIRVSHKRLTIILLSEVLIACSRLTDR